MYLRSPKHATSVNFRKNIQLSDILCERNVYLYFALIAQSTTLLHFTVPVTAVLLGRIAVKDTLAREFTALFILGPFVSTHAFSHLRAYFIHLAFNTFTAHFVLLAFTARVLLVRFSRTKIDGVDAVDTEVELASLFVSHDRLNCLRTIKFDAGLSLTLAEHVMLDTSVAAGAIHVLFQQINGDLRCAVLWAGRFWRKRVHSSSLVRPFSTIPNTMLLGKRKRRQSCDM